MINNLGGLIAAKQKQFKKKRVLCRLYKAYLATLQTSTKTNFMILTLQCHGIIT